MDIEFIGDSCISFILGESINSEIIRILKEYDPEESQSLHDLIIVPTVYDGEDLERVARIHSLTIREVVAKHSKPVYKL